MNSFQHFKLQVVAYLLLPSRVTTIIIVSPDGPLFRDWRLGLPPRGCLGVASLAGARLVTLLP